MRDIALSVRNGALVGGVLVVSDLASSSPPWGALPLGLGLGLGLGAVIGASWAVVAFALRRALSRFAPIAWPVLGLLMGLWFARSLGAFARLDGSYRGWAVLAIVGGGCAGAGIGALAAALQPTSGSPRGWISSRSRRWRAGLVVACVALAFAATWVDRSYLVGLYPIAHSGLRVATVGSLILATLALDATRLALPRAVRRPLVAAAAALVLLPCLLLDSGGAATYAIARRPLPGLALDLGRTLTDVDGDGHSSLLGGGDCAPFDAAIHPGATEIPGNGIDENCLLGDAEVADTPAAARAAPVGRSTASVLLITVDALRADRMSLYGYDRDTTPRLREWAGDRARIFTRAYTAGGRTTQSLPAMMRGVFPRRLDYTRYYRTVGDRAFRGPVAGNLRPGEQVAEVAGFVVEDPHQVLAVSLREREMFTAAAIGSSMAMFYDGAGLDLGFERFRRVCDGRAADECEPELDSHTTDLALDLLEGRPAGKRFFLWVHYFGVHLPDTTHPGLARYGDTAGDAYDHEVAYFDLQVDRLLDAVGKMQEPVAVILTSDHGEVLEQHTRHHGAGVDDDSQRVPLIVAGPGVPAGVDDRLASTVDVFATVLSMTSTPAPSGLDALDLLSPPPRSRFVMTDSWQLDKATGEVDYDTLTARDGTATVIVDVKRMISGHKGDGDHESLERLALSYLESCGAPIRWKE